jgi:hypothetical protein
LRCSFVLLIENPRTERETRSTRILLRHCKYQRSHHQIRTGPGIRVRTCPVYRLLEKHYAWIVATLSTYGYRQPCPYAVSSHTLCMDCRKWVSLRFHPFRVHL